MKDERPDSFAGPVPNLRLRPEAAGDEPLLFELYASTREEEMALTGWDEPTRTAFVNLQFRAMRQGYRSMFPHGEFSIILENDTPIGRLVVDRPAPELHVVDIVLSKPQRNRGIGTAIMQALMAEAGRAGKPVRLHVLKNSRAIQFYQRLGFVTAGENGIYEQMEWRAEKAEL